MATSETGVRAPANADADGFFDAGMLQKLQINAKTKASQKEQQKQRSVGKKLRLTDY